VITGESGRTEALLALVAVLAVACGCERDTPPAPESQASSVQPSTFDLTDRGRYPAHWWEPVPEAEKAWWEVVPQAAGPGEVVLSKRNELGQLSNFAATPFVFRGKQYASLEGFWQSMKYPEGPTDPRATSATVIWERTREEVMAMVAFEAKEAGDIAGENMAALGIDWITFEGERIHHRGEGQGRFYEIVEAATWAKVRQNPEVERILVATGDLILRPDHLTEENAPAAWRYYEIYMKIRDELAERR
jgi:predicted NAD-dependent protein-ADP-ribosyltransferase YbiA (DUF1768 family)